MELEPISVNSDITLRACDFDKIAIKLEMLVEIFHRIKCHSAIKASHTFRTMVFYVVIELKKVIGCRPIWADRSFFFILEIYFAAMAFLEVGNQLPELLMLHFLVAICCLARGTLFCLATLTNNFFTSHALLKIQGDFLTYVALKIF